MADTILLVAKITVVVAKITFDTFDTLRYIYVVV